MSDTLKQITSLMQKNKEMSKAEISQVVQLMTYLDADESITIPDLMEGVSLLAGQMDISESEYNLLMDRKPIVDVDAFLGT